MSQQEDDLRALAKIMDFMRGISFVLVAANMLWFTGIKTVESGWFYSTAYKILNNLDNACGLFHNPNNAKWFALLLLALSCFGTKGVKKESIRWKHIIIAITAGIVKADAAVCIKNNPTFLCGECVQSGLICLYSLSDLSYPRITGFPQHSKTTMSTTVLIL